MAESNSLTAVNPGDENINSENVSPASNTINDNNQNNRTQNTNVVDMTQPLETDILQDSLVQPMQKVDEVQTLTPIDSNTEPVSLVPIDSQTSESANQVLDIMDQDPQAGASNSDAAMQSIDSNQNTSPTGSLMQPSPVQDLSTNQISNGSDFVSNPEVNKQPEIQKPAVSPMVDTKAPEVNSGYTELPPTNVPNSQMPGLSTQPIQEMPNQLENQGITDPMQRFSPLPVTEPQPMEESNQFISNIPASSALPLLNTNNLENKNKVNNSGSVGNRIVKILGLILLVALSVAAGYFLNDFLEQNNNIAVNQESNTSTSGLVEGLNAEQPVIGVDERVVLSSVVFDRNEVKSGDQLQFIVSNNNAIPIYIGDVFAFETVRIGVDAGENTSIKFQEAVSYNESEKPLELELYKINGTEGTLIGTTTIE